jgi:hypothetical protein
MEDNINMDFEDVAWEYDLNWSGLVEDQVGWALVNAVINFWVL